jgi:hypothetical protein
MANQFEVPAWMVPYIREMVDLPGGRPEDLVAAVGDYGGKVALMRGTPEGQAIAAEVQISLLMRLRVAGLLKEAPEASKGAPKP